jgi:hypothetical protein
MPTWRDPVRYSYIRKHDKMEHTETNINILNRYELVYNIEYSGWSTCCTECTESVV